MDRELDIRQRLPVWTVLSELFLDTSFDETDYDRIAAVLLRSPYQRDEIKQILRHEVSPAFSGNLLSIAGEWAGWSESDVKQIMEQWLNRQAAKGWLPWIEARLTVRVIPADWYPVAARLSAREPPQSRLDDLLPWNFKPSS